MSSDICVDTAVKTTASSTGCSNWESSSLGISRPPALIYTPPEDEDTPTAYFPESLDGSLLPSRQRSTFWRQHYMNSAMMPIPSNSQRCLDLNSLDNNNNVSLSDDVFKASSPFRSARLTLPAKHTGKSEMASAMLTASLPEEYHHNGSTSAATVDPATSSSNHSSPGSHELSHSPQRRPNSTDNHHNLPHLQPDKVTEDGGAEEDSNEPVLALGNLKTEALSYHGSLSGRSSTEIPVVVENEAEPNSHRDHGEMLLEKLEKEFQTTPAPRSLFNGGDNSSDGLGTPPGLQIVLPADPDVSINSSSGMSETMLSPSGAGGGSMFNYHGDSLSPEHPRNFAITPVVENGREVFYCHLCSFCGTSRDQLNGHLDGHFEHQCDKCDYTSRTEGRLKQHVQRFHGNEDFNDDEAMDHAEGHSSASLGNPMLASIEGYTTQPANQRTPGRQKVYRCKQCNFSATIKVEFWNHARSHIKEDKILQCPKCPFVTEYKHHLEYHLRNHFGSKPFKCNKCNYACVNKSMLNSHMKSHTNIYQYRCADCTYATKYCHSLKLHLRKYNHKPASILNLDGTIDHDTSSLLTMKRSGPKSSKLAKEEKDVRDTEKQSQPLPPNVPQPGGLPRFPHPPPGMLPFWPLAGGMRPTPPPLIPVSMSNFFRGLMPPMLNPSMMPGQVTHLQPKMEPRSQTSPNPEELKSRDSDFKTKSTEELIHHSKSHHLGMHPPFNMFGAENRNNNNESPNNHHNLWPGEMMGMNSAVAKAALAMPPFGPPNMQFGGYPKGPQHPAQNQRLAHTPPAKVFKPALAAGAPSLSGEAPLDLTKSQAPTDSFAAETGGRKRSRKGKAYKLDELCLRLQEKMDPEEEEEEMTAEARERKTSQPLPILRSESADSSNTDNTRPVSREPASNHQSDTDMDHASHKNSEMKLNGHYASGFNATEDNNNQELEEEEKMSLDEKVDKDERKNAPSGTRKERYSCPYCDISFTDCIMYTMHMGYHGYQNPFKCNMCGDESNDKVSFFLHIARAPHA